MKIGIITFHWATNFGAVLQAYALQQYLISLNYEVEIINYKPPKYDFSIRSIVSKRVWTNILQWKKERGIKKFRNRYLNLTQRYYSEKELVLNPPICDIYITGSDQVWNPYFTQFGEGKTTLSYFLSFGDKNVKKIAYAVSFGVTEFDDKLLSIATPVINNFTAIGVREKTGLDILKSLKFKNQGQLVPDPTLLLNEKDYGNFIRNNSVASDYCFIYILRNTTLCRTLTNDMRKLHYHTIVSKFSDNSIEQWLTYIKFSKFVITNSYHGMLFCIQFHKPFVIVSEQGHLCGMNDRFYTILNEFGLKNRVAATDLSDIQTIIKSEINWAQVDLKLIEFKNKGYFFLKKVCE